MKQFKIYLSQPNSNLRQRIQPAWDREGWNLTRATDWGIIEDYEDKEIPRSGGSPEGGVPPDGGGKLLEGHKLPEEDGDGI